MVQGQTGTTALKTTRDWKKRTCNAFHDNNVISACNRAFACLLGTMPVASGS